MFKTVSSVKIGFENRFLKTDFQNHQIKRAQLANQKVTKIKLSDKIYERAAQTNSKNARRKNMDDSCTPTGNRIENEWFEYLDKNWHLICVQKPVDLPKVFSRRDAVGLRVRQKLMIRTLFMNKF